ncbi:MAG TPA: ribosome-associated translation inhibitor RaiA [Thermoanaerobaculia bacterium]|jgi:putative sigma-54 modulation protein
MEIKYTGRHFQVDDRVKTFADGKLSKMTRFLEEPIEIHLTLEVEKHRQVAELHATHRHGALQATEEAEQMLDAIQAVVDKVEKQARRSRKKHQQRRRRAQRVNHEDWPLEVVDSASVNAPEGPKIIKTGRLPIKPMTLDEAALGLASSKNDFFVFRDSVTDKVSVLYRRRDGHYGLIAPEF